MKFIFYFSYIYWPIILGRGGWGDNIKPYAVERGKKAVREARTDGINSISGCYFHCK